MHPREVFIVWLTAIGLALGVLGTWAFVPRGWRGAREPSLGWMSEQWLAEHRAGSR
jgi:hypothetical protein